jgi:predicted Zn-dependent protease with MMP-like domain
MGMHLPDKITIFKDAIESVADFPSDVKDIVKIVVWHEIAHHFGFEEKETRQLEKRWRSKLKKSRNS